MTTHAIRSIMIDHREPPSVRRLNVDGITPVITQLDCGDIWIAAADGTLLIVERKTANDLLASIADGRLFEQSAAMIQVSPWSVIVVEGTLMPSNDGRTLIDGVLVGWRWASVQGALQTVQELGVPVVYISDTRELAPFLIRLAGRDRGPVKTGAPRKPELLAPGMALLMSLPGIGGDRAKTLLEQAGNAAQALSYLTDLDWTSNVIGIGDGTKNKVRDALGLDAFQKLTVITEVEL